MSALDHKCLLTVCACTAVCPETRIALPAMPVSSQNAHALSGPERVFVLHPCRPAQKAATVQVRDERNDTCTS
eukprot:1160626-Pelagomonas_calceolata.AAC.10